MSNEIYDKNYEEAHQQGRAQAMTLLSSIESQLAFIENVKGSSIPLILAEAIHLRAILKQMWNWK